MGEEREMVGADHHVLTRAGDATQEVQEVLSRGGPASEGLIRFFFVSRANQTVVLTADASSPIALLLRDRQGWREPGRAAGH